MPLIHQVSRGTGGLKIFEGPAMQDGSGWGSLFGGLLKSVLPAAKSAAKYGAKMVKRAATSDLGRSLIDTGVNAAITAAQDTLIGSSKTNEHLQDSVEEAKQKVFQALEKKKRYNTNSEQPKQKRKSKKRSKVTYPTSSKKRSKFDLLAEESD